jgi:hypothetical protein
MATMMWSAVAYARRVVLRPQDPFQLPLVVDALVCETYALAALPLLVHGVPAALAEPEEQRVLPQEPRLDVVLPDGLDDALDSATGRVPDLPGRFRAVTSHELVELEFAVGGQHPGAAAGGAAADDVLLDQDDLEALLQELRRRADAAEASAHDEDVALDVFRQRCAIGMGVHHQGGEPPVLVDQSPVGGHFSPA